MELLGTANGDRIVELARGWIGTRYHHQASVKGVGCDCIGLIVGVWRELFTGRIPAGFEMPKYTPNWSDETGQFYSMAEYMTRYLIPIAVPPQDAVTMAQPGDVVLFRMSRRGPIKHSAIMSYDGNIIHSYAGHNVIETACVSNLGARMTHVFRYPGDWKD